MPEDWVSDVRQLSEDGFFELADHLPAEAAEALLDYVVTGVLRKPDEATRGIGPFEHPDAQRRFRVLHDVGELQQALAYPWDQWTIFLHPSQRRVVNQEFNGPARVSGSAGTGKTVVALHRTAAVLKKDARAKVLLTTFSSPLANALERKLRMLTGNNGADASNVTILPFEGVARDLYTLAFGPYAARCVQGPSKESASHRSEGTQAYRIHLSVSGFRVDQCRRCMADRLAGRLRASSAHWAQEQHGLQAERTRMAGIRAHERAVASTGAGFLVWDLRTCDGTLR